MSNHDWILTNLINVMAYAEREGLVTVSSVIEQTIAQIAPALADDARNDEEVCRQQLLLGISSPRR